VAEGRRKGIVEVEHKEAKLQLPLVFRIIGMTKEIFRFQFLFLLSNW
jgi:hypothetical protein